MLGGFLIVLAIPDFHAPFGHKDAADFLSDLKKEYKPQKVICLGDEVDAYSLSDWDHSPDAMSAGDEYKAAIKQLQPLYKLFPKVMVCESNHGRRPFRKALKAGLPEVYMRKYHEFMQSPKGWHWAHSWTIDSTIYQHGDGYSGAQGAMKAAIANRRSTVIGHIHSNAGAVHLAGANDQIFALNAGCLVDTKAYAFAYGAHHGSKPVLGAGIIIDGSFPIFEPMR